MLTEQEAVLGRDAQVESSRLREPRRTALPHGLQSTGFMGVGLVSGLSLADHLAWPALGLAQGPSWWHMHLSAKMDSCIEDPRNLVISSLLLKSKTPLTRTQPKPSLGLEPMIF